MSSNNESVNATSQERGLGEDYNCGDELRRSAFNCFVEAMDLLQDSKVRCARKCLHSGHGYLVTLTAEDFCNPTDYEKQQVRRGKEMSLRCVSGPPLCAVILLDQMDSDQDDHDDLYINFTIAFGALAFKLHEHNMAIEVFKLAMNTNGIDSSPHRKIKVDFEFSVVVAKANIGCVYLILGQLEKAKEYLECALKCLERFKLEKNIVSLEVDIFAVENNLSLVLQGQQNYPASINLQNDLVSRAKHVKLPFRMVAAMHYNRAELSLEVEDPARALKELQELKSLSEILDDENGIPEEFVSSKICLVYLLMKEVALAEEIAVKLSLSPSFSLLVPSMSLSWLPSSSSLSPSSLSSSSLSTSSSSSSSSLLSSTSSSSPPSSPPPSSSSEFEVFYKSNGKLPWDFSVASLTNLVDFHLYQENVQPVITMLDLCVSSCREMFGKSHPAFASLLYRQGVKFSLTGQNVSSKNCFEEALSIYTTSGFALTHPEVSRCNAALARLILRESFQEEIVLSSQTIARTPSDSGEQFRKSQEFIFSDSIASSSLFEKFVQQIIKSEEKFGEISELVMTNNLLKIQGPSVGQITVWLHDRSIKMNTQPTHGKKSLVIDYEESLPCNRADINEVLVEEMKMCASSLGVPFETYPQTLNVKAMTGASNGSQNSFDDEQSGAADNGQTSTQRPQQVIGSHEDRSVRPYLTDDMLENADDDDTDCVVTHQDHNEDLVRKLHSSNQESHGNGKVVKIERSPKRDGVKGMGVSRNREERRNLAYKRENDANNSFCRGEDVVADNGDAHDAAEVRGACGYQNKWCLRDADFPREGEVGSESGSKKKRKETLGLKGGRRHEFPSNHSSLGAANISCTSESSHLGIKSGFLARHSNDNSMSCSMDEAEGRFNCTKFCQFPDCEECSSRDTATASITALASPPQSFHNFNNYQPEQSISLSYKSKYRDPKNEEVWSLPPPLQFPSLPHDVPQERHYMSEKYFEIGAVQTRTRRSIDSDANLFAQTSSNTSTWLGGFTNPEIGIGLGEQNAGINQREIGQSPFSAHSTSTTPNFISEQAETSLASERAMREQERERIEREAATAIVLNDGISTTVQPSLPNSNSGRTSDDDDSLVALERRVAEACSLVERVLKEREEKDKAIKERERRQREERARRELQEQERIEREARETMQRNANTEGTSTGSEEEAPFHPAASPENPQWLCEHYQRLCRVKFLCCGRFYPCHRCHNNSGECQKDNCKAKEAFYIECSVCGHQQAINRDAHTCARCKTKMSAYFCSICKHFTGEDKHPYHCTKCGICRIHKDRSFHCDVCNVCLDKRLQGNHNCRPDSGHDECCICLEDAFSGCQILPCSHKVHRDCAIAMIRNGVRSCPICRHLLYSQSAGTE